MLFAPLRTKPATIPDKRFTRHPRFDMETLPASIRQSEQTEGLCPSTLKSSSDSWSFSLDDSWNKIVKLAAQITRVAASLKVTVGLLLCALFLVFGGTLAQVNLGIFRTQEIYFQSFFLYGTIGGWEVPVLPAGYTIGSLLLINLISAFLVRFRLGWRKTGILMVHAGLILLLVGMLATDLVSTESQLRLSEGESRNYTESIFDYEFVAVQSAGAEDIVVSYPAQDDGSRVMRSVHSPVVLQVRDYAANAQLIPANGRNLHQITAGTGRQLTIQPLPITRKIDEQNIPAAIVEVTYQDSSIGTFLLSGLLREPERIQLPDGDEIRIALRPTRYYLPYSLQLNDFKREVFPGTNKPKHFESRITISGENDGTGREAAIYMNHPLRYNGKTFYQASFANNGSTSILQVVENPSWLFPYVASGLITSGLLFQFVIRLKFTRKAIA